MISTGVKPSLCTVVAGGMAQTVLLIWKTNPFLPSNFHVNSTTVVDSLILRALALLRRLVMWLWLGLGLLVLSILYVQWLCVVVCEGLGVERIHQTL